MTTTRVVRYRRYGGPEVLEVTELELPPLRSDEVRVRVRAAGVNPADWKVRSGARSRGHALDAPTGLGHDAGGVVEEVGEDVEGFRAGDAVIGFGLEGAYASRLVTTSTHLVLKPTAVSFRAAAGIGVPFGTAYQVLRVLRLTPGETVLVHAGAGAVGQAAIQLAREWGARVIATAGTGNQELLRRLGAEPVVYGPGLLGRLSALAPDGVHAVVEGAGTPEALEASLALTSDRRRIGEIVNRDWREQFGIPAFSASAPGYLSEEDLRLRAEAVPYAAKLISEGRAHVAIQAVLPLGAAGYAHRMGESGHASGKTVLIP